MIKKKSFDALIFPFIVTKFQKNKNKNCLTYYNNWADEVTLERRWKNLPCPKYGAQENIYFQGMRAETHAPNAASSSN